MTEPIKNNKALSTFEHRKNTLEELVIFLNKSTDSLNEYPVETIVEGFWIQKQNQALAESEPFTLKGE